MNTPSPLLAGVRRADITPPIGIQMAGFAARGRNTGCHDPLTATALVLTDGHEQAAVVACDLIYVPSEFAQRVGAEVQRRCGVPAAGYVPVPQAYVEGGYEVEMACRVDPAAAGLLTEACLGLLGKVAG